jgi:hypothetical protein
MRSFRTAWFRGAAFLVLMALSGCGGGPNLVPVTGTLKYKGQPVPNAVVHFTPAGGGRPSSGPTDQSGRFKLQFDRNQEGVLLGKNEVGVTPGQGRLPGQEPGMEGQVPKDLAGLYQKYTPGKSPKVVEVTRSTREIDLDLD